MRKTFEKAWRAEGKFSFEKGLFVLMLSVFVAAGFAGAADAVTYEVTNGSDSGIGSLRYAIAQSNSNLNAEIDEIVISPTVSQIDISTGEIPITNNVVVRGQGIMLQGSGTYRLFRITSGEVRFERVTFVNGGTLYGDGGAVDIESSAGNVTFENCTFFDNHASLRGGAVNVNGGGHVTTFVNCTLTRNSADNGGAVSVQGGNVQFIASIVTGNSASSNSSDADIYVGGGGSISRAEYNVVGTNALSSFTNTITNSVGILAPDVFKTPSALSLLNGAWVAELRNIAGNAALEKIPPEDGIRLSLPTLDERGVERPQMNRIDAGAMELKPVVLTEFELKGPDAVEVNVSEDYAIALEPEDATLNVRGDYPGGLEWTASPSNALSVERSEDGTFLRVTGLLTGEAALTVTAHGWGSDGKEISKKSYKTIRIREEAADAPVLLVSFENVDVTKGDTVTQGDKTPVSVRVTVEPKDTSVVVNIESLNLTVASVGETISLGNNLWGATIAANAVGDAIIRVTAKARNSKGGDEDVKEYLLSVVERRSSGGGGGGCNTGTGFALLGLALSGGLFLRKGDKGLSSLFRVNP